MDKETHKAFVNILDTFTGADGGVKFVMFREFLNEITELEKSGNQDAAKALGMIRTISNLIDAANSK